MDELVLRDLIRVAVQEAVQKGRLLSIARIATDVRRASGGLYSQKKVYRYLIGNAQRQKLLGITTEVRRQSRASRENIFILPDSTVKNDWLEEHSLDAVLRAKKKRGKLPLDRLVSEAARISRVPRCIIAQHIEDMKGSEIKRRHLIKHGLYDVSL